MRFPLFNPSVEGRLLVESEVVAGPGPDEGQDLPYQDLPVFGRNVLSLFDELLHVGDELTGHLIRMKDIIDKAGLYRAARHSRVLGG